MCYLNNFIRKCQAIVVNRCDAGHFKTLVWMRKIGVVLSQAPGRSETFLLSKISGLIAQGFRVIVFSGRKIHVGFDLCPEITAYPLPVAPVMRALCTLPVIMMLILRSPMRLIRFCRLERSAGLRWDQIIRRAYTSAHILPHSLDYIHFSFATLGVGKENVGKTIGAKVSVSFRGFDICIFPLTRPGVYTSFWKALDRVHTISDDLYREARLLGLPESVSCTKIQPAISTDVFRFHREWTASGGVLRILTVARLQWKKGLEVALDAMSLLKEYGVAFHYTIVGMGPESERLYFSRSQLCLEDEVTFAGWKTQDEVAALMKSSDIYLQPSLQEGFCNAVLEAQSSGLMCIVTDAEGLPENVVDTITGWVVPKWDARALAKKIVDVQSLRPNEKLAVSERATERIDHEFDLLDQQKQFANFFSY